MYNLVFISEGKERLVLENATISQCKFQQGKMKEMKEFKNGLFQPRKVTGKW
jgi:hypothetical protein